MKKTLMALALGGAAALAQAGVIDFNPPSPVCSSAADGSGGIVGCTNYGTIAQSHGDVPGVLDVQYTALRVSDTSLSWWDADYNTLRGVAWAVGGDGNSAAQIDLLPLNGMAVTVTHFDLGAYSNTARGTHLTVSAIGGPVLFSYDGNVGGLPGNMPSSFDGSWSSLNGIRIEWHDSAYNVGIDNITYSVNAVPEPSAWLMLALGLGAIGVAARRRA
ncbi:PEP-CTERM sorting domain-containing protein [Duganella sp. HH105]|uniref:PEP-CTERM sorting domain-containing protein n=1 Tax=Duganella sp. HH105 TaxID=1781067 RepID=UPI000893025B|nr:PEP-CTERM sorting domain-containing protein [Duganella sp. HH105]OEZ57205.1 PEP-CTERM motif protein [Duganella sp. HH105]